MQVNAKALADAAVARIGNNLVDTISNQGSGGTPRRRSIVDAIVVEVLLTGGTVLLCATTNSEWTIPVLVLGTTAALVVFGIVWALRQNRGPKE